MDKESLRVNILNRLSSLSNDEILSLSFKLTNQIIKFFSLYPDLVGQIGAAYLPLKSEVAPLYQELMRQTPLSLSFPVLVDSEMKFGVSQGIPKGGVWLDPPYHIVDPQWFLVPGVGFDLSGARLGRGKGYYDRFLEKHDGPAIGLGWSKQIVEKIPVEDHDCHMDFIITEKFCWDVSQQTMF